MGSEMCIRDSLEDDPKYNSWGQEIGRDSVSITKSVCFVVEGMPPIGPSASVSVGSSGELKKSTEVLDYSSTEKTQITIDDKCTITFDEDVNVGDTANCTAGGNTYTANAESKKGNKITYRITKE